MEKFIQAPQAAQQLAHKWEKERAKMTMRPKVYTKNTPRTKQRWQKVQKEYQAAGGKFILIGFNDLRQTRLRMSRKKPTLVSRFSANCVLTCCSPNKVHLSVNRT